jgi:4-hydroxy-3-methylbut-2-enyl diphosphate reductase IspH
VTIGVTGGGTEPGWTVQAVKTKVKTNDTKPESDKRFI